MLLTQLDTEISMATEREILERAKKFEFQGGIPEMREFVNHNAKALNAKPPEIGAYHPDVELRSGLRADICVPKGAGPHPTLVYLHGGGWVSGSSKTHTKLCMEFAAAGYLTVNVDYRLAPEHPFPAGLDDCIFASKWSAENAGRYNGDAQRLAIGGDSAGGNLTAATLISLAGQPSAPKFKAALLLYAMLDIPRATKATDGNPEITNMMIKAYLGDRHELISDPRVTPLNGIEAGIMPPTFLLVGTADNLVPDTYAMAELLRKTETPHEVHVLENMPHAFLQIWMVSGCAEGLRLTTDFLRRHV
jgi:acetyl esterase